MLDRGRMGKARAVAHLARELGSEVLDLGPEPLELAGTRSSAPGRIVKPEVTAFER
jgi:hypothetical protein